MWKREVKLGKIIDDDICLLSFLLIVLWGGGGGFGTAQWITMVPMIYKIVVKTLRYWLW